MSVLKILNVKNYNIYQKKIVFQKKCYTFAGSNYY